MSKLLSKAVLLALFGTGAAQAEMVAKPVEYDAAGTAVRSVLVYDDASKEKRPGLVMVPNWMGVTDAAIAKAKKLAGDDYVILVADVFGKDVRPKDRDEALATVKKLYGDVPTLRARAASALDQLNAQAKNAPIDGAQVGAIGFCFGGSTVLELARSGAALSGVVSFHGGLDTGEGLQAKPGAVKASVLAINGANDTAVKPEAIAGFEAEMKAANADWQFVNIGGAVHCFTEEGDNFPPNCIYDATAAKRAYAYMEDFFDEKFGD